jgi:hypothetical protein
MTMTTTRKLVFLAALGLVLATDVGRAHAAFQGLTLSPRARAMGEASVAVPGDAWSFSLNPALLATVKDLEFTSSTAEPNGVDAFRLTGFGAAIPLPGDRGGIAVGFRHWSVDFKDVNLAREQTLTFAHGFSLYEDATSAAQIGWALNFYNLDFGTSVGGENPGSAWTWGLDLGASVKLYDRTRAGFYTRNLNNPTIGEDQEELRQLVAAGLSYEPYEGVITAFDIRSELGEEFRFHGGTEWAITEVLRLRMGIETDPAKLTGGFGVRLPNLLSLDYGFSSGGGTLDESHQFGLTLRFGPKGEGE